MTSLKRFAFKVFDLNGDQKLSENDLFELVHSQWEHKNKIKLMVDESITLENKRHTKIMDLRTQKEDLFIEVFMDDYLRIIKAIDKKKQAKASSENQNSKPLKFAPSIFGQNKRNMEKKLQTYQAKMDDG